MSSSHCASAGSAHKPSESSDQTMDEVASCVNSDASEVCAILLEAIIASRAHDAANITFPTAAQKLDDRILQFLASGDKVTPREIVQKLSISRSAASQSLSRLTATG